MPITQVDKVAALVVFDLQNDKRALSFDFFLSPRRVSHRGAINHIGKHADAFRHRGWPVVFDVSLDNALRQ